MRRLSIVLPAILPIILGLADAATAQTKAKAPSTAPRKAPATTSARAADAPAGPRTLAAFRARSNDNEDRLGRLLQHAQLERVTQRGDGRLDVDRVHYMADGTGERFRATVTPPCRMDIAAPGCIMNHARESTFEWAIYVSRSAPTFRLCLVEEDAVRPTCVMAALQVQRAVPEAHIALFTRDQRNPWISRWPVPSFSDRGGTKIVGIDPAPAAPATPPRGAPSIAEARRQAELQAEWDREAATEVGAADGAEAGDEPSGDLETRQRQLADECDGGCPVTMRELRDRLSNNDGRDSDMVGRWIGTVPARTDLPEGAGMALAADGTGQFIVPRGVSGVGATFHWFVLPGNDRSFSFCRTDGEVMRGRDPASKALVAVPPADREPVECTRGERRSDADPRFTGFAFRIGVVYYKRPYLPQVSAP